MPTPIPSAEHQALAKIVNGTYLDKVDRILAARVEDDKSTITFVAQDGKRYLAGQIAPGGISYRFINPAELQAIGAGKSSFAEPEDTTDTVDEMADALGAAGANVLADWLATIQDKLNKSRDLPEFAEAISSLYADLDNTAFLGLIGQAIEAAALAGAAEGEI